MNLTLQATEMLVLEKSLMIMKVLLLWVSVFLNTKVVTTDCWWALPGIIEMMALMIVSVLFYKVMYLWFPPQM